MAIRSNIARALFLLSVVGVAACGARGKGAHAPHGGAPDGDAKQEETSSAGAPGLRERLGKVIELQAGANYFGTRIDYEGGPNESWVIGHHQGRPIQPDYEMKPSGPDDKDVKPLAASAGAFTVPLAVPTWCNGYVTPGRIDANLELDFLASDAPHAMIEDLRAVAIAACDRLHYAPRQRRVQRLLQTFVNKTHISQGELAALLPALIIARADSDTTQCGVDPLVRSLLCGDRATERRAVHDRSQLKRESDPADVLDELERSGKLDDRARFTTLFTRIAPERHVEQANPGSRMAAVTRFRLGPTGYAAAPLAVFANDIESLNWQEVRALIGEKETDPVVRFLLPGQLAVVEKLFRDELAKVPADVREKAQAAQSAWQANYERHKEIANAAFASVADPSSKECEKLDSGLGTLLTEKAPKSRTAAYGTLSDPIINLVVSARQGCHKAAGATELAALEEGLLRLHHHHAGKRRAGSLALAAPENRGNEIFGLPPARRIASVKAVAQGVEVRFVPAEWVEEREHCVETNRIGGITAGGRVYYRQDCTPLPPLTHKEPFAPLVVSKELGAVLKPKQSMRVLEREKAVLLVFSVLENETDSVDQLGLRAFMGHPLP
jgi:hypothetical protein